MIARTRRRQAFSLVEISLALGVIAFALLALVGLLSQVLESSQGGTETFLFSNVAFERQVELEQLDWVDLPTAVETMTIDNQGDPAPASDAAFEVVLSPLAGAPQGVESSLDATSADALRFFRVEILRLGSSEPLHVSTLSIAHRQ